MSGPDPDGHVPTDMSRDARVGPGPRLRLVPPPVDDRAGALAELDALLARPDLDDAAVARLAALVPHVPGRQRPVVAALAALGTPAAVAALLELPHVPGALEAVSRALAGGLTRDLPPPLGSAPIAAPARAPVFLALDFRGSRARPFPDLLRRAQLLAADPGGALRLEVLRVGDRPAYRLSFWPETLAPRARAALARASAPDLALLHARLARLRGTRLWLNGFCLDPGGRVSPAAQSHLLSAWLARAEKGDA